MRTGFAQIEIGFPAEQLHVRQRGCSKGPPHDSASPVSGVWRTMRGNETRCGASGSPLLGVANPETFPASSCLGTGKTKVLWEKKLSRKMTLDWNWMDDSGTTPLHSQLQTENKDRKRDLILSGCDQDQRASTYRVISLSFSLIVTESLKLTFRSLSSLTRGKVRTV